MPDFDCIDDSDILLDVDTQPSALTSLLQTWQKALQEGKAVSSKCAA